MTREMVNTSNLISCLYRRSSEKYAPSDTRGLPSVHPCSEYVYRPRGWHSTENVSLLMTVATRRRLMSPARHPVRLETKPGAARVSTSRFLCEKETQLYLSSLSLSHKTRDLNPNLSGFAYERTSLLDRAFFQCFSALFPHIPSRVYKINNITRKLQIVYIFSIVNLTLYDTMCFSMTEFLTYSQLPCT